MTVSGMRRQMARVKGFYDQLASDYDAMTDFAGKIRQPVDAIFCLGNSIAHLVTAPDLNKTLKQFCMLLNPNGLAVVHQLNPALLEEPLHLASFRAAGEILWQRFYLSVRGEHRLCWLRLQKHDAGWKHIMVDTAVRLRQPQELAQAMPRCGFRKVELQAALAGGRFLAGQSRDLYVLAQRGLRIS